MAEERRLTITSSPLLDPDDVARHSFTTVRRGFEPNEVRAYLESLSHGLANLAQREQQLLEEVAAAERRAANPELDEQTLVTALGQHTARVLQSAHEVADELTATAREEADRLVGGAAEQAEATRAAAEVAAAERVADAESTASRALAEAESTASRALAEAEDRAAALMEAAQRESDELRERTKDECRAMVEEAQQLRARVLADLSRRRKLLHAQIDQLRAGRERLAETIDGVRRSVDEIADDLFAAEDNAREAAELAARAAADRTDEESDELAALLQGAPAPASDRARETSNGHESEAEAAAPEEAPPAVGKVDALFAKLRAGQESEPGEGVGGGNGAGGNGAGGNGANATAGDAEAADRGVAVEVDVAEVVIVVDEAPTGGASPGEEEMAAGEPSEEGAEGPPADRPPAVVRRDELVAPVLTALSRRLKRTLQDTQNDLLDQLRSNRSQWSASILPDETEQVDGLATAVLPVLERAAQAGATFAGGEAGSGPAVDDVLAVADELAAGVVGPLRRRLSEDDGVAEAGEAAAAEHVNVAFRDWRGPRIERLAGDYVLAAFSLGSIAAVRSEGEGRLEWMAVAGSGDAPCPDCEDNGLAGPLAPGEEFPTGHRHPPAHPGCRCLVAPSAP